MPVDLLGVVLIVALANFAAFGVSLGPLRIVVGVLFVLFVPGYALVAALFPESGTSPKEARAQAGASLTVSWTGNASGRFDTDRGVDIIERIAFSFGLSFAIVPLLALGVTLSPLSFSTEPLFAVLSVFTIGCTLIALVRRLLLPTETQVSVSAIREVQNAYLAIRRSGSRGEIILNIALAAAVLLAVGTLGFAVISPQDGEQYTELYVLNEDTEGELVAEGYPDTIGADEPTELHVGIENYEHERVEYHIVVQLQRVETEGEETVVTDRYTVDAFSTVLSPEERWVTDRELSVSDAPAGEDRRLKFLLYKDSVPDTPTEASAYRQLHIWVDVEAGDEPESIDTVTSSAP